MKRLIFILAAALFLIAGCEKEYPVSVIDAVVPGTPLDLFPLKVGNKWTYWIRGDSENIHTVEVTGNNAEIGGFNCFEVTETGEQPQYYRASGDTIYRADNDFGLYWHIEKQLLHYPDVSVGDTLCSDDYAGGDYRYYVVHSLSTERSVEAGVFDCYVVRRTRPDVDIYQYWYYVHGIGLIYFDGEDSRPGLQLASYTIQD